VVCGSLGALLYGLGLIASSQCRALWQLYVTYGIMLGVGQSLGLYSGVIACNKWFPENTALASGFANSGAGVGPFAIPFLWAALKRETNGWRGALAALGAMVFAVLLAGALGLAPPPPSSEKRAPVEGRLAVSAVPGVRRLMRTTFIFGFGFWIPAVHIVRYGLDRDLSRRRAESLLLYLGAGALTMRVPVGALADRCGRSRVYSAVCLTYAVALACTCVETLRHRSDAVIGAASRRWRGPPEI
jgi:OFA family oxalate/formate antiporter-like MFS transporter